MKLKGLLFAAFWKNSQFINVQLACFQNINLFICLYISLFIFVASGGLFSCILQLPLNTCSYLEMWELIFVKGVRFWVFIHIMYELAASNSARLMGISKQYGVHFKSKSSRTISNLIYFNSLSSFEQGTFRSWSRWHTNVSMYFPPL